MHCCLTAWFSTSARNCADEIQDYNLTRRCSLLKTSATRKDVVPTWPSLISQRLAASTLGSTATVPLTCKTGFDKISFAIEYRTFRRYRAEMKNGCPLPVVLHLLLAVGALTLHTGLDSRKYLATPRDIGKIIACSQSAGFMSPASRFVCRTPQNYIFYPKLPNFFGKNISK